MKIDRNAVVAGQPVRKVRDLLRWLGTAGLAVAGFAERLAIPEAEAERWLAGMLELGLLEPSGAAVDGAQYYRVTRDGAQLAAAVFLKRIARAKGERIIADLLDRADIINADPDLLYRVATIDVFGSYITDAPELGDLDLVLTLKFKDEKGDIAAAMWRALLRAGAASTISTSCASGSAR
jgi:hypothetical protein